MISCFPAFHNPLRLTSWLVGINVGLFFACLLTSGPTGRIDHSPLWPLGVLTAVEFAEGERIYKILTYMFFHANLLHLIANMVGLWSFGRALEQQFGAWHLLCIFLVGGISGSALWLCLNWGANLSLVGASAAVLALVVAFTTLYPREKVWVFPIPVPMEARFLSLGFLVITILQAWMSLHKGGNSYHIAHLAHLGGMVVGFLYAKFFLENLGLSFFRSLHATWKTSSLGKWLPKRSHPSEGAHPYDEKKTREFFEKEVDQVLEKLSRVGYENLTVKEKNILRRAQELLERR